MMTLDQVAALPQSGRYPEVTTSSAFDVVGQMGRMSFKEEEMWDCMDAIARGDEGAQAMLTMLHCMLSIERLEALYKSMGLELSFPAESIDEMRRIADKAQRQGGAA